MRSIKHLPSVPTMQTFNAKGASHSLEVFSPDLTCKVYVRNFKFSSFSLLLFSKEPAPSSYVYIRAREWITWWARAIWNRQAPSASRHKVRERKRTYWKRWSRVNYRRHLEEIIITVRNPRLCFRSSSSVTCLHSIIAASVVLTVTFCNQATVFSLIGFERTRSSERRRWWSGVNNENHRRPLAGLFSFMPSFDRSIDYTVRFLYQY